LRAECRFTFFHTKRKPDKTEASVSSPTLLRSGTPMRPTQLYESASDLSTNVA